MEALANPGGSAWRDFMTRTPDASIFQAPEMAEVYRDTKGYTPQAFYVEGYNGVQALLSCVLIRYTQRGTSRLSTRSIVVGGPVGDSNFYSALLSTHDAFASRHALSTEIRNLRAPEQPNAFRQAGYQWEDHLNFVIDLSRGETSLLNAMSRERRKGIQRAQKNGIEFVEISIDELRRGYALLHETYARARVPLADISLFENAFRRLASSGKLFVHGAIHGESLCAVRFILSWDSTLFDWYAGSTEEGRRLRANELVVWETLRRGIKLGYTRFDFGGAGHPQEAYGPGEFKRTFGGERLNPGRFVKVYHPLAQRLSKTVYNLWRQIR